MKKSITYFLIIAVVTTMILPITSKAQTDSTKMKITVYPNPVTLGFWVQNSDPDYDGATIAMFDVNKRLIAAGKISMGKSYFPVVDYENNTRIANASYVLRITSKKTGKIDARIIVRQ